MQQKAGKTDTYLMLMCALKSRGHQDRIGWFPERVFHLAAHFAEHDRDVNEVLRATDAELLAAPQFGPRALAVFRTYVPAPEEGV